MTTKTLLILTDEDGPQVFDWSLFLKRGKTQEEIRAAFGDAAEFLDLTLRPPTRGMENDVERACLVPNELMPGSFRLDAALVPVKRFTAYVKTWSRPERITDEAFTALPLCLADAISSLIQVHLYPNASPNFTHALKTLFDGTTPEN